MAKKEKNWSDPQVLLKHYGAQVKFYKKCLISFDATPEITPKECGPYKYAEKERAAFSSGVERIKMELARAANSKN